MAQHLVEWIPLSDVPRLVEFETGGRPSRQTVYNWARRGWLRTNGYTPLKTTRPWINDCLNQHRKVK